jgi:hypothetical protein
VAFYRLLRCTPGGRSGSVAAYPVRIGQRRRRRYLDKTLPRWLRLQNGIDGAALSTSFSSYKPGAVGGRPRKSAHSGDCSDLKAYRCAPTAQRTADLEAEFDRVFAGKTGFITLDRLLARLHANKAELLKVLDRPEIPLHTNGSENDIRCHVTRRKVSGGTRSDLGRDARDTFLGLAKTCSKHGISFWNYLGARLNLPGAAVPPLANLILARTQPP